MSYFEWNDTLLKARLKLPCVSWAWFGLTIIPAWDNVFSIPGGNRVDSGMPWLSGYARQPLVQADRDQNSESPPVSNEMRGARARTRGIEQCDPGMWRFHSTQMFANPQDGADMYMCVCVFMCILMCVPNILAISGHLSETCFYFPITVPSFLKCKWFTKSGRTGTKGKPDCILELFLVIGGDGVEVSEFFYLCPEQGWWRSRWCCNMGLIDFQAGYLLPL